MIGVFDSGVGGIGVLRHIRKELPRADLVYVADQANAPYGIRTLEEVAAIATEISSRLIDLGAETIVIACNTASAAGLHTLRARFPATSFVGMEPAVKPAAMETKSGVIGVLATAATFQSELYESVVRRFAGDSEVVTAACPAWVELVEEGRLAGFETEQAVEEKIAPLLTAGADVLVLGCTHFPFLVDTIRTVAGSDVTIVDPAPAVARQTARIGPPVGTGRLVITSTGSTNRAYEFAIGPGGLDDAEFAVAFDAI